MRSVGRVPNSPRALRARNTYRISPTPVRPFVITSSAPPTHLVAPERAPHVAQASGIDLYVSPRASSAQAIRAVLLARATATSLNGRRCRRPVDPALHIEAQQGHR